MSKVKAHFNRDNVRENLAAFRQGREAIARAEERARNPKPATAPMHKAGLGA